MKIEPVKAFLIAFCVMCLALRSCIEVQAQTKPLVRVAHESFVSYYDPNRNTPALVVYELRQEHFAGTCKVKSHHFKMDKKLPTPRVKDSDYTNSGFVRGHLCSAADRDSKVSWLKETYLTSNLVPMTMVCNSGPFKVMEDSCRWLASHGHPLKIVRVPIGNSQLYKIRPNVTIQLPTMFLCFALCLNHGERWFWKICNTRTRESCITSFSSAECNTKVYVSQLLHNILGSWSREEYEIITR